MLLTWDVRTQYYTHTHTYTPHTPRQLIKYEVLNPLYFITTIDYMYANTVYLR